jgi:chaperone BCS1
MRYQIDLNDVLFKSILYFGVLYTETKSKVNVVSKMVDDEGENKDKIITYRLPFGDSFLKYKEHDIHVHVSLDDPPCIVEKDVLNVYSLMELSCNDEPILKEFITAAREHYLNMVLDKKKEPSKVMVFVWDDYWEVLHKHPERSLDTIYLDDNIKETMVEKIKTFRKPETEEIYKTFGIPYKMNILLEGYPGTGKTSIIYAIASYLKLSVAILNFDKEMTDFKFMRALRRIPEDTVLILEDIDVLFKERKENDSSASSLTFSGVLNCLDGIASSYKQIVFMTTNYKCNLDKALYRPGRIDASVHFDYATKNQIQKMFNKFFPKRESEFADLYKKIKHTRLTTAMLQQYFFSNLHTDTFNNVDELIELAASNDYNENKDGLYT